jgi:hypothetical protein
VTDDLAASFEGLPQLHYIALEVAPMPSAYVA